MHAAKKAPKQAKKAVKQQKRKIATKKVAKVAKKSIIQQSQKSIATAAQKTRSPLFKQAFASELTNAKASFDKSLDSTLTIAQRDLKVKSFQLAWTKNWLCRRGLYYEDVWEEDTEIQIAIDMLPADVRKDRVRRQLRSVDLEVKLVWLPAKLQDYDPFVSYGLDDAINKMDMFTHEWQNYV